MARFSSREEFRPFLDSKGKLRSNVVIGIRWQWFLLLSKELHGQRYEYDHKTFTSFDSILSIVCLSCKGVFKQKQQNHCYKGHGCPICATVQHKDCSNIYVLRCKSTGLIKIGVSSNTKARVCQLNIPLEIVLDKRVPNAWLLEKVLHGAYAKYRVHYPTKISGYTEFFNLPSALVGEVIDFINTSYSA